MNDLVLVVEDENDVRSNLEDILLNQNYNVMISSSCEAAIEAANHNKPDIVISDIILPGLSGYDLLNYFRKNPMLSSVPFVFLSSKTSDDDLRYAMNLGADDYLKKPFRATDLIRVITTRIKRKKELNT
ncbi:MAG: response regulator [Ignavibacteriales bacterium]|nr:MAG: response regulator [Ignavibacteriales bacterium]